MIKISWYKYAIISMIIAAVFGITLGMGTTCLIPVSFAVLGCSANENFHNDLKFTAKNTFSLIWENYLEICKWPKLQKY